MEVILSDLEKLGVQPALDHDLVSFAWDSYIRLKVTFSSTTELETNLELISNEFEKLWNSTLTPVPTFRKSFDEE